MNGSKIFMLDAATGISGIAIAGITFASQAKVISPGAAMAMATIWATVPAICVSWRQYIEAQERLQIKAHAQGSSAK